MLEFTEDILTTYGDFKHLMELFEKNNFEDETKIALPLVMQALYPNAFKNFDKYVSDERTKAYIEGYNIGKEERDENN